MIYFKHPETGEVFAYETEAERQQWGAPELVAMMPEEVEAHLNPPIPADARRKAAKDSIDAAAGDARRAFVSVGWGVEEEYRLAKQETDAWIAAGKPANDVPPAVAVWAQARGWTAEQAAQDILDTEAAWVAALSAIRQARLLGKAAVDAAPDDADFAVVAAPYIAQLAAIAEQAP